MKRKLLTVALACIMCLSSFTAFAVKRSEEDASASSKQSPNLTPWGSFDTVKDKEKNVSTEWSELKWVDDGKGGGYISTAAIRAWMGTRFGSFPFVPGETYDLYFDARTTYGESDTMYSTGIWLADGGDKAYNSAISPSNMLTGEWQTYHIVFTLPENPTTTAGEPITNTSLYVRIRRTAGGGAWFDVDNLKVFARGNTDYDWSEYLNALNQRMDPFDSEDGFPEEKEIKEGNFADVADNHWANNSIKSLAASSYVQGMGDGTYSPEGNVTRAEFMTLALNTLKFGDESYKDIFEDVKADQWFADTIQSAYDIGLINGSMIKDGKFFPDKAITREEAASVLAKLANLRKENADGEAKAFSDSGKISDWAKDAVTETVKYGLINGYPDGEFKPKGTITRAETAEVFFRLIELNSRLAVFVDGENGSDKNNGTKNAPVQTIEAARDLVQPYLKGMQNHIFVYIKEGDYNITETLYWDTSDSGMNGFNVVYTSMNEEEPEIRMAEDYTGFKLHDKEKNIWKVYIGKDNPSRDVFINGVRGVRARSAERYSGPDAVDAAENVLLNATKTGDMYQGVYYMCENMEFANFTNQEHIEFIFNNQWVQHRVVVKDMYAVNDHQVRVDFTEESMTLQNDGVGNTFMSYPSWIENAYELLDAKGEWYINRNDGYLYYRPRDFENPETMVATVPTGSRQLMFIGNSTQDKIHNIVLDNLSFKYTTWTVPNRGINDNQADFYGHGQYDGDGRTYGNSPDPAVTVVDGAYLDVTDCTFSQLGGCGLTYREVMQNCEVIGNDFHDIGYTAVSMGNGYIENKDDMKYWRVTKYENYMINNKMNNNLIHDIGVNGDGAPGLIASLLINSEINHNEIYNTPYSGMHIGYGWGGHFEKIYSYTGIDIMYNYIHDTMRRTYDGGCVYVLGHAGGRNNLAYNYFENHRNGHGSIYLDEGSDLWHVYNNVVDVKEVERWSATTAFQQVGKPRWLSGYPNRSEKLGKIHTNWSTTDQTASQPPKDGCYEEPMVFPDGNFPAEAQEVIKNAGLEPEYAAKYPDSVQRLRSMNEQKDDFYLEVGDTMSIDVKAYMRKLNEVDASNDLMYYSTNESVATVDGNGKITAIGRGKCEVYAEYLDGDVIRRRNVNIITDNLVTEIRTELSSVAVLVDNEKDVTAIGKTVLGIDKKIVPTATYDDPTLATITKDGNVRGLKEGSTIAHMVWEADGVRVERDVKLFVNVYNHGAETLAFEEQSVKLKAGDPFFKAENWSVNAINPEADKLQVYSNKSTGGPSVYNTPFKDGKTLISFDMTITNPGSWPSFTFNIKDPGLTYSQQDTYLMGFQAGGIELQRFNNEGERTSIFGADNFNPIGGPVFPNKSLTETSGSLYNYGSTYSITVGAIDVEEGVRIILIINGQPIIDYLDYTEGHIKGSGYFGIYEQSGTFTFEPFTGRKFIN